MPRFPHFSVSFSANFRTLTVTADRAIPAHFAAASGNLTDDQKHRDTWNLLVERVGRRDFLDVADSKPATVDNMGHIAGRGPVGQEWRPHFAVRSVGGSRWPGTPIMPAWPTSGSPTASSRW
ncbi:MAG TPA: hypothetical protein VMY37_39735 [Thermoguttaceae bacterium]|nr:hypothetical protein [Thermoguttaceae bacterium]